MHTGRVENIYRTLNHNVKLFAQNVVLCRHSLPRNELVHLPEEYVEHRVHVYAEQAGVQQVHEHTLLLAEGVVDYILELHDSLCTQRKVDIVLHDQIQFPQLRDTDVQGRYVPGYVQGRTSEHVQASDEEGAHVLLNAVGDYTLVHEQVEEAEDYTLVREVAEDYTPVHKQAEAAEDYTPLHEDGEDYTSVHEEAEDYTPVHEEEEDYTPVHEDGEDYTPVQEGVEDYIPVHGEGEDYTPVHEEVEGYNPVSEEVAVACIVVYRDVLLL